MMTDPELGSQSQRVNWMGTRKVAASGRNGMLAGETSRGLRLAGVPHP
jgi:hypothetical protein